MSMAFPYELLEDPERLARYGEWSEEVYRDFLACERGELSEAAFRAKYAVEAAILQLDMTGMTQAAIGRGSLFSLLRIFDVQKICGPVFERFGATHIRAFADDFTAIFDTPDQALDTAFEIHRRMTAFNRSEIANPQPVECSIGLGYGEVFRIGPDLAMGDQMNQASKLGEDTAEGGETLITVQFHKRVQDRADCRFEPRNSADLPFPFFCVTPAE